jgi:hypothetical protein
MATGPGAVGRQAPAPAGELMLLLDSEALSAIARGPAGRRDRARVLITEMRRRELPIATVAAVLAEVVRGRAAAAAVFAGLRRQRVEVRPVDTAVGVRAGQLLGAAGAGSELPSTPSTWRSPTLLEASSSPPSTPVTSPDWRHGRPT